MIKWEELQNIGVSEYREDFSNLYECRLYFKGGSDEDIAHYLLENLPMSMIMFDRLRGDVRVELKGIEGYKLVVRFSRIEDQFTAPYWGFLFKENVMKDYITTDHMAEEEYLSQVEIERYWLSWDDYEFNQGETVGYYKDCDEARKIMRACIRQNSEVHYTLIDLETGEWISHYDPSDC